MKKLLMVLPLFQLAGCIQFSQTMTCYDCGDVSCTGSAAKPVEVGTTLQAQVPVGGSTMTNAAQSIAAAVQKTYSGVKK
jgi:hypothetical protein